MPRSLRIQCPAVMHCIPRQLFLGPVLVQLFISILIPAAHLFRKLGEVEMVMVAWSFCCQIPLLCCCQHVVAAGRLNEAKPGCNLPPGGDSCFGGMPGLQVD